MKTKEKLQEEKAAILKGIAHPVRLRVVEALARREMSVCEIAELFDFDRTTISKHLSLMKDLGILDSRKDGLHVIYRLKMRCLASVLSCVEKVVRGREADLSGLFGGCGSLTNFDREEEQKP